MPATISPELAAAVLLKAKAEVERRKRSREIAEECRNSFRKFVPEAWSVVEPSRPLTPAWYVDSIAEHLQAVADGQIQNLLINISPGSAKSVLCSVMFPAWMWTHRPQWRSTFASYDSGLSTRDSVRCRDLLESVWYRETFQPAWKLSTDQNEKTYYVNTDKGFRVSTSVGGKATGWRSDTILCLAYDTKITTDAGQIAVGRIVEERLPVKVLSFSHGSGVARWSEIERYESSLGRSSVRVSFSDGSNVECTEDHPVFVVGIGYVKAIELQHGAKVITQRSVRILRQGTPEKARPHKARQARSVLRQGLRWGMAIQARNGESGLPMQELRHASVSVSEPRIAGGQRFLQLRVPSEMECRPEQSSLYDRRTRPQVSTMRSVVQGWSRDIGEGRQGGGVLQQNVQRRGSSWGREPKVCQSPYSAVRGMWIAGEVASPEAYREKELLLKDVRGCRPQQTHAGHSQPTVRSREWPRGVPAGVQKDCTKDQEEGRLCVPLVREDKSQDAVGSRCSPHRLRQNEQRPNEPCVALSGVPREGAWINGSEDGSAAVVVESVERIHTPDRVFNVRVAEDHNYFANKVLLHNCDDPINVSDSFSDAVLDRCILWWSNTMWNRLISMKTGSRVIIMQRVGDRDLSGHVLRTGGWEHLCIPMEFDPARSRETVIGWKDPRTVKGELMSPLIFPQAVVDDTKRTIGAAAWSGQYQQSPAPDGGGILKAHQWNYWQPRGLDLPAVRVRMPDGSIQERTALELPDLFDLELQSWDLAFKDLKTSDYVAGAAIGVRGADRFLRKMVQQKMDLMATINAIRQMTADFPKAHLKLIEDKANGPAVMQSLQHEISGMVAVNPEGTKMARVAAMTPDLEAGNWYLPHPMIAPWVGNPESPMEKGFLAEATLFPYGANDDMCDAVSQANLRIHKEQVGGALRVPEQAIIVDPFEFDEKWPRMYGLALTWEEIAAVWMCRRPETGQYYFYAEYCAPPTSPAQHAADIQKPGDWIRGVVTPVDIGRDERDGYALIGKYRNLRLHLDSIRANDETMIVDLQDALRKGSVKVFGNLSTLLGQYRMFRRDDKGKLPSHYVGAVKAMLVAWAGKDKMKAPPEPPKPQRAGVYREGPSTNSWMGS